MHRYLYARGVLAGLAGPKGPADDGIGNVPGDEPRRVVLVGGVVLSILYAPGDDRAFIYFQF